MNARKIESSDINDTHGIFCEHGYVSGLSGEIAIQGRAGWFLVSEDDFERQGAFLIRPKASVLLAIGGLPEREEEKLAKELGVSVECAIDVLYLRTRSRWSEDLEKQLIQLHKDGKRPNMSEFGCSRETAAQLYWQASQERRNGHHDQ